MEGQPPLYLGIYVDNFTYFSNSDNHEQHWLSQQVFSGGVECLLCGHFLYHDCVYAFCEVIKTDHPELQDSGLEATVHLSPEHVMPIPVGHCCVMKEKEVKQPMTFLLPSVDPFLAGATHYYQYDLAIGSTPWNVWMYLH
jgi:hypothetical protein